MRLTDYQIEQQMKEVEDNMRQSLLGCSVAFLEWGLDCIDTFDWSDVVSDMAHFNQPELDYATMLSISSSEEDREKGREILTELAKIAVEQVIGGAKIREHVIYQHNKALGKVA